MIKTKQCTKCKKVKDISDFCKDKSKRDNLSCSCKQCTKNYYENNKKTILEWSKNTYKSNKKVIYRRVKEYRKNNKNKVKDTCKKYKTSNAKYETYYERLTIDENPKLDIDGITLEVKCRYCGKYFIPIVSDIQHRIESLKSKSKGDCGLYCSEGCKQACPIFNQVIHPKDNKPATSREVQPQLRQMVLERDNYTCQKCGKPIEEIQLHCHHKYPLNESPVTSADIDECITFCIDCHKWVHMNVAGCGYGEMRCSA